MTPHGRPDADADADADAAAAVTWSTDVVPISKWKLGNFQLHITRSHAHALKEKLFVLIARVVL